MHICDATVYGDNMASSEEQGGDEEGTDEHAERADAVGDDDPLGEGGEWAAWLACLPSWEGAVGCALPLCADEAEPCPQVADARRDAAARRAAVDWAGEGLRSRGGCRDAARNNTRREKEE
eukprot:gene23443-61559_t